MAMSFDEGLDDNGEMHEVDVTPFIDVMLVLLIIFMVAVPLATVDVKANLPASISTPQPRPEEPVYLSVKTDKSMFIGNNQMADETVTNELNALTDGKRDTTILLRANKTVDYETMMKVMDTLHQAGFLKIGLVGEETVKAKRSSSLPGNSYRPTWRVSPDSTPLHTRSYLLSSNVIVAILIGL